jgi:hypothetical protein
MEDTEQIPGCDVPKQCPLLPLVNVNRKEGKVLGSEEGKTMGNGLFCRYEKGKRSGVFTSIYKCIKFLFVPHREHTPSP